MLERGALRSRAHALAITAVLVLGVFAAIVLASSAPSAPVAPARSTAAAAPVAVAPVTAPAAAQPAIGKNDAAARRAALPLYFEPNVGQSDPRVRFLSQSSRYSLFPDGRGGGVFPGRRPDSQRPRAGDGESAAPAASRPVGRIRGANPDGRGESASSNDRAGAAARPRQLPDRK